MAERLTPYVNPFVGTDGYGNVYPGAQIPFGGIQISPDTDADFYDAASGYKYSHSTLMGFSLTHLSGTGIPDLGDFLFVPGAGEIKSVPGTHDEPEKGYRSHYSHDKEWASPGYYGVELIDYGVKAEMTAASRSGFFRFTYPKSDQAFILIDMNHTLWQSCPWANLRQINDSTLVGYKLVKGWGPERHVYFAATFSCKLNNFQILQNGKPVIYDTKRFRSHLEAWGEKLMFYGGWKHCNVVKLTDDLLGLRPFDDGEIYKEVTPDQYVEGPFMLKRNGKYYFMWSEGGWGGPHYSVAYAIADSPLGPFKRIGKILQQDTAVATGAGHHSVIQVPGKDQYYIVYHRRPLGYTGASERQVCIDKLEFDDKGYIKPVKMTFEGVEAVRIE